MTDTGHNLYDAVLYPGVAYDYTHPDRMATVASLHGLESAPAPRCRVLEVGCSIGTNIIPMAFQYPGSAFVGIDLSEAEIAKGNDTVAGLGLKNIVLRCADIMDIDAAYGSFDYIIAHGVYSWVPAPVREKLLSVFNANLAPNGVVYVSYNSFPGSHLRNLTRDIMLHHVQGMADPHERIAQARGVLKFLADASANDTVYGAILRDQFERVAKMNDEVLFHDDLLESSTAFLLREVVRDAKRHGLQYLSDATFARSDLRHESAEVVAVLDRLCGDDLVARHQYQDFIEGHGFRRSLLCQGDVSLRRTTDPNSVKRYLFSGFAKPATAETDPTTDEIVSFKTQTGGTLSTNHPLSKAAILHLDQCWPQRVSFPELLQGALQRLGSAAAKLQVAEEEEKMAGNLFRAANGGFINIHLCPPQLTTAISERPQASPLARSQVRIGPMVTNQQHRSVLLDDPIVRCFLPLIDGTRTVDDLVGDLKQALGNGGGGTAGNPGGTSRGGQELVTGETVGKQLALLAGMGLMVA